MYFCCALNKGKHIIHFLPKQKPFLKSIKISQVEDSQKIIYIPVENNPAKDGNRRQWMSFVIMNLKVKSLNINAKANNYEKEDDDDIKLIINGEVQKNDTDKSHKHWYWCGRVLKGQDREFSGELEPGNSLQYIELWADRKPFLYKAEIKFKKEEKQNQETKIIPTVDNPKWTGDFIDDTEDILLARLIFGEANNQSDEVKEWVGWSVINRAEDSSWWPNTIRGVILQEGQYDPFKSSDPTFDKITNPLGFKGLGGSDQKSWYDSCEIAIKILEGKTNNPTEATHFHGAGPTKEWFIKNVVPEGKFLKKIDDTYFYWSPN